MDKRTFLKSVVLAGAGVFSLGFVSAIKASRVRKKWNGIYKLPALPYSYEALEPYIDSETMRSNHLNHHAKFTNNLNSALLSAGLVGKTTHQLLKESRKHNRHIIDCAGGYANHRLFWTVLSPAHGSRPSPNLISAFEKDFGSFEDFKIRFGEVAKSVAGSGWAWLIVDKTGTLQTTATRNNDNPVMDIAEVRGFPILCLDICQHAYPVNQESTYIESFWNIVHWDVVSRRYERLKEKTNLLQDL